MSARGIISPLDQLVAEIAAYRPVLEALEQDTALPKGHTPFFSDLIATGLKLFPDIEGNLTRLGVASGEILSLKNEGRLTRSFDRQKPFIELVDNRTRQAREARRNSRPRVPRQKAPAPQSL